ncbi:MAG TPA: PQQ-binding-like beta-propeller repeat protein [Ktedonobacterales bacterium]
MQFLRNQWQRVALQASKRPVLGVGIGVAICAIVVASTLGAAALTNSGVFGRQSAQSPTATSSSSATPTPLPALKGNDWTHYRYDLSGTGNNPEGLIDSTNVAQLKQAWTWDAPDVFASTPAVVGRTIYIPNGKTLNAVNLRTGAPLWKFVTDTTDFINSSVTVDPQTQIAYFGTPSHQVFAVSTRDGTLVWKTLLGEPNQPGAYIWSSPLLINGKIYIGLASTANPCIRGALYALDAATGKIAWTHYTAPAGKIGGGVWASPIAFPQQHEVVIATGNPCPSADGLTPPSDLEQDSIVGIDWDTGATQWVYTAIDPDPCDCDFGGGPVNYTYGGQQYFVAGNKFGTVYALRLQGKGVQLAWSQHIATLSHSRLSGIIQPPTYADGTVFVAGNTANNGSCAGKVWALAADTGAIRWQACTDHPTASAGAVSGDVYFNASFGSVVAYRATTGEVLWHADLPGADVYGGVTISHGALLVGTTKTLLHSFTLDGLAP